MADDLILREIRDLLKLVTQHDNRAYAYVIERDERDAEARNNAPTYALWDDNTGDWHVPYSFRMPSDPPRACPERLWHGAQGLVIAQTWAGLYRRNRAGCAGVRVVGVTVEGEKIDLDEETQR